MPFEMGEIGGYEILSELGGGRRGRVYKAQKGGRLVALKVLGEDAPLQIRRLKREAEALQRVRNPNVSRIEDVNLEGRTPFIATEFIEGLTLARDVLENGIYEGKYLAMLSDKLAFALRDIHSARIIHRDVKPENVIVADRGPVLVDFGISMGYGDCHLTRTGLVMGTPGYIAPELITGGKESAGSDWWSLSAVLAFSALGRSPFGKGSVETILYRERNGIMDFSPLNSGLSSEFAKALSPDPAKRPPIKELIDRIWHNV